MSQRNRNTSNTRVAIKQSNQSTLRGKNKKREKIIVQLIYSNQKWNIFRSIQNSVQQISNQHLEQSPILYAPNELIDKLDPISLFDSIEPLKSFAEQLQGRVTNRTIVKRLIFGFLSRRANQLWSIKYAPKKLQDIFSVSIASEIEVWFRKFRESMLTREDLSEQEYDSSNSQLSRLKQ